MGESSSVAWQSGGAVSTTGSQYNSHVSNLPRQMLCCGNSYAIKARDGEIESICSELEVKLQ